MRGTKFLTVAYYKHAVAFRLNRIKRKWAIQKFVKESVENDKKYARLLALSMEQPFEKRPQEVLSYFEETRNHIVSVRHAYFHNLALEFNLLDNFEMAICHEFFIQHTYNFSKLCFIPERIIDCGAYRGYFSFLALKYFPKASITAVEAHPENFEKIKGAIQSNNITNIELLHGAICRSANSSIELFFEGSSGSMENTFGAASNIVKVKAIDLEQFINQDYLLLKVDIEGAELDFFPAIISKLPSTCAVFLETHDGWNSLTRIKTEFENQGFSFEVIREQAAFIDSFAQRKKNNL